MRLLFSAKELRLAHPGEAGERGRMLAEEAGGVARATSMRLHNCLANGLVGVGEFSALEHGLDGGLGTVHLGSVWCSKQRVSSE